ncbi:AAA family ATPase [Alloyangia pacifica]|uniref:Predicted kinase n=1 Tax=Alloyangia pacifica TaxID=311180 RepID=A0A1I6NYJ0_9RHOB|nr:AAA family ATPase [Alloyangia pacifica]SDH56842.1 Predicted kinase [Alloyangia pacifica]SFS33007.1 Predicted kinase [Alloyangia pacifica]
MAVLVILSGLPAVGKSAVARALAARSGALWLRIDAIEQAMRGSHMVAADLADGGYAAARAVARGALAQGLDVIADCVNPWPLTRAGWEKAGVGHRVLRVELCCSDPVEHRRRVETREADIEGLALPDWAAVQARDYRPWPEAELRIDMAMQGIEEAAARIAAAMEG